MGNYIKRIILLTCLIMVSFVKLASSDSFEIYEEGHVRSKNGRLEVYVKVLKEFPWLTNREPAYPSGSDEIWIRDLTSGEESKIIGSNYQEVLVEGNWDDYLGNFDSLQISPDGSKLYFLCQNCPTNAVLFTASIDGSNVRRIRPAHGLRLIDGCHEEEYNGYLLVDVKDVGASQGPMVWKTVLLDEDCNFVKVINTSEKTSY